jgi:hypothetical protein
MLKEQSTLVKRQTTLKKWQFWLGVLISDVVVAARRKNQKRPR